jgi:peptidoglycan/LPS O-acetylase OafA/YrhL
LSRCTFFLALWCVSYVIYVSASLSPTFSGVLFERLSIFVDLFVYFGCGVLLYLFRTSIPFSPFWACVALALVLVALPLGGGSIVMPVCLPYLMVFCGLSVLPGKVPLKYDLSYGVYLIHAPMLTAFIIMFPSMHIWWIGAAAVFLVTLVLAYASWICIEGPALKKKKAASNWGHRRIELIMLPVRASDSARTPATERSHELRG